MIDSRWDATLEASTCVPFRRKPTAGEQAITMGFLDACPDLVLALDEEGRFAFANPAWERLLGWTARELTGTQLLTIVHAEDRLTCASRLARLLAGEDVGLHELRVVARDGRVLTLEGRLNGGGAAIRGILRDVSERKERETRREQALGEVGHDLRTPLSSLKLSVDFLLASEAVELPAMAREVLQAAGRSVDRLIRLTEDLTEGERQVVAPIAQPLAPLLAEAGAGLASLAREAGIAIVVAPCDAWVMADLPRLDQVLTNLLGNALKFSGAGTVVRVEALVDEAAGVATVRVVDQGRGIPADKLEAIFERYTQVEPADARNRGGLGLGLAIARQLVEAHGGRLWAESGPGQGSTFAFTLPLA